MNWQRIKRFTKIVAVALFWVCFWPRDAYAWGPAVHSHLALYVLANLGLLTPLLGRLLKRYPNDFFYGNLSADIILGKKFIDYYYHCHNWRVGLEILEHTQTDAQRAFAYGYLSHLAADVLAHNLFIPDKMVRTYHTLTKRHAYWEVRYDLRMDPELLKRAHRIAQVYHEKNDALLENILRETIFSFKTNKKIFNGLLTVQKYERVRSFLEQVAKRSPLPLKDERAQRYLDQSQNAVIQVLNQLERSEFFKADPAGHFKLDLASNLRQEMRRLKTEKAANDQDLKQIIKTFHDLLQDTLYENDQCPDAKKIIENV